MAYTSFSSKLEGCFFVNFRLNKLSYLNFNCSVLKELCADFLLSYVLLKLYSGVGFSLGSNRDKLQICNRYSSAQVQISKFKPSSFHEFYSLMAKFYFQDLNNFLNH